jgi:hypothetical protein
VQSARTGGISISDFERKFGPVTIFNPETDRISPAYPSMDTTHVYVHPESSRTFYLCFSNGALLGYESAYGIEDAVAHLPSIDERISQMMSAENENIDIKRPYISPIHSHGIGRKEASKSKEQPTST